MAWRIELARAAVRDLDKLDPQQARRILRFLYERVAHLEDPRSIGEALTGSRLGEFWKYRIGNYRLICDIQDQQIGVLVLRVGHRGGLYRQKR
jgi:mRNA interferase RelE/StbE